MFLLTQIMKVLSVNNLLLIHVPLTSPQIPHQHPPISQVAVRRKIVIRKQMKKSDDTSKLLLKNYLKKKVIENKGFQKIIKNMKHKKLAVGIIYLFLFLYRQNPQEDTNEKAFYISFDNEQRKRPKPPQRTKRSPKRDKNEIKNKVNYVTR